MGPPDIAPKSFSNKTSRKGFCRNPRGIFPNTKSWVNFAGDFSGLFPWKKQEETIHPKIHGKIQIRIWELRGQNPHCKDLVLMKRGQNGPLSLSIGVIGNSAKICGFLRFPAKICGFFAVFCANLRLPNPLIYRAS